MSDNILSLSKHNNSSMRSVEDALKEALESVGKDGAFAQGKKVLILALDDTNDKYQVSFIQAGMKMSQCLSLCEVSKAIFLNEMEY